MAPNDDSGLFPENRMRNECSIPAKCCTPLQTGVPNKDSASSSETCFTFWGGYWLSPRPISIRQLHALLRFHLEPIDHVFFMGSYALGNLILRGASRLDAFSVYPVRT